MTLENKLTWEHVETINGIRYGRFVEHKRFVDINNLEKYTVKQLISILGSRIGGSPKKHHYIDLIKKQHIDRIKQENREYNLDKLVPEPLKTYLTDNDWSSFINNEI